MTVKLQILQPSLGGKEWPKFCESDSVAANSLGQNALPQCVLVTVQNRVVLSEGKPVERQFSKQYMALHP